MIDAKLLFSDMQAVTSTGATASTNVVDLGTGTDFLGASVVADILRGPGLYLNILVGEAVTSGGAATVTFSLQDSADNSSFASILSTQDYAKTALVLGFRPTLIVIPPNARRYLRVAYTVSTAALTAGKFSAWLSLEAETNK